MEKSHDKDPPVTPASHIDDDNVNIDNDDAAATKQLTEKGKEGVNKQEETISDGGGKRKRKASSSPQQSDGGDDVSSMGSQHSPLSSNSYVRATPPPAGAASASVASMCDNDDYDDGENYGEHDSECDVPPVPPAPPSTPVSVSCGNNRHPYYKDDHYATSTDAAIQPPQPPLHQRQDFQDMATPLPQNQHNKSSPTAQYAYPPTDSKAAAPPSQQQQPPPTEKTSATSCKSKTPTEDFSDWAVGDRYELIRILGRGSYGEVAQARDLHASSTSGPSSSSSTPSYVAIKRITSAFDQEVDAVRLYREMHILRRLKGHDCIIQLLDVIKPPPTSNGKHKEEKSKDTKRRKDEKEQASLHDEKEKGKRKNDTDELASGKKTDDDDDTLQFRDLYLVFEYVDTDLYKLIMSPQYLTTEHIQTFLYQMLTGIKYIHSSSVIHRDLKPANILLNEDCSLKICDFGLARIVNSATMSSNANNDEARSNGGDSSSASSFKSSNGTDSSGAPPKPLPGLTRQLTKHVVTRWYRAPELILIQPYTSAVDIWSLGCILAELLSMQEGSVPGYQDRVPLFPGGSCYPLSGEGASVKTDERLDQLSVIFSVIGTPSAEDVESIGKANDYINTLEKKPGRSIEDMYPAADPSAIDLLKKMLQFNPRKRCTAEEALEHEFLRSVRRQEMERSADQPLIGPEFLETNHIDMEMLKRRTYEEVLWYRDKEEDNLNVGSDLASPSATEKSVTNAPDAKSE